MTSKLPDYPILTERLRLRPLRRGDVDAVFAYRQRADVAQYLFDLPLTREACAETVQQRSARLAFEQEGDAIFVAAERLEDNVMIGEVSLAWRSAEARQAEIGFIFNPEFGGQGYATEAAAAILTLAFRGLDIHRVFGRCDARNMSSARLMERLGMRREAHFRHHAMFKGQWDEEFVYAILEDEWTD